MDGATLRSLAARAASDPAALAQLRTVTQVDGQPVDIARALETSDPAQLAARLRVLSGPAGNSQVLTSNARKSAAEIVSQDKYKPAEPPRPFRRPLEWLGRQIEKFVGLIGLPGGSLVAWIVLALMVVGVTTLVVRWLSRRNPRKSVDALADKIAKMYDPAELEQAADAADRDGEWEAAIRYRFRAGLLRLREAGRIDSADTITTGQVARVLKDADFNVVARGFDAVVYGRRRAGPKRASESREGWKKVLEGSSRD